MAYAIIDLQSKQYWLKPGDTVAVNGVLGEVGKTVKLGSPLLVANDQAVEVGTPQVEAEVSFEIVSHHKSEKIRVAKYKSKSRYRRVNGHRQDQTTLKLVAVGNLKAEVVEKPKKAAVNKVKVEKKTEGKTTKKTEAKADSKAKIENSTKKSTSKEK